MGRMLLGYCGSTIPADLSSLSAQRVWQVARSFGQAEAGRSIPKTIRRGRPAISRHRSATVRRFYPFRICLPEQALQTPRPWKRQYNRERSMKIVLLSATLVAASLMITGPVAAQNANKATESNTTGLSSADKEHADKEHSAMGGSSAGSTAK